jgi:hypothetical protein
MYVYIYIRTHMTLMSVNVLVPVHMHLRVVNSVPFIKKIPCIAFLNIYIYISNVKYFTSKIKKK